MPDAVDLKMAGLVALLPAVVAAVLFLIALLPRPAINLFSLPLRSLPVYSWRPRRRGIFRSRR